MKKTIPLYIREENGKVTSISAVLGVYSEEDIDRNSQNEIVAALNPEFVITRKEFEKQLDDFSRKNYENYRPLAEALKTHGQLTARQISRITKKPEREVKQNLDRMYKANLLGKKDGSYTISTENIEELASLFGLKEK